MEENDENLPFTFSFLPDADFPALNSKDIQTNFMKWGIVDDMKLLKFKSDRALDNDRVQEFIDSFFTSDEVVRTLHANTNIRIISRTKLETNFDSISTAQTSLKMFRTLEENDIVMDCGKIRGRLEEDYEGVPIYDILRESLLMEDSEKYAAFSEVDRKEFLFRIFKHIVTGGAANQYEDSVDPYYQTTGLLYKDLVTVKKNDSGDLQVTSFVWEIKEFGEGGDLFSKSHLSNFCYLVFDPLTRQLNFWYFQHKPIW